MNLAMNEKEFTVFHMCCGSGGGKRGFNRSRPRVQNMRGRWRCIGGIDVDPAAIRDFDNAGPGRPGTVMDLFTRAQYIAFHGKEPPPGWREATPEDIRRAAGYERPNAVFISSPCKGASGLLSEQVSKTAKYQALNELTLRCIWLMSEAWAGDPVDLIIFENVPRLATRGRHLLDQINQVLQRYGYAIAETTHDCGEIGHLAQSRKRFLLVARHMEKVPPFVYEPEKKPLRAVGDVLGRMPLPGDPRGGPMHRIPRLHWKTWVRLAFVEAGKDWRSLDRLAVENGVLRDYLIVPEYLASEGIAVPDPRTSSSREGSGPLGVNEWSQHTGTVTGNSRPGTGTFSVADPRFDPNAYDCGQYGVCGWNETTGAVINVKSPGQGTFSVQDPRFTKRDTERNHYKNCYRVVKMTEHASTITGGASPSNGGLSVADPRPHWERHSGNLSVMDWLRPSNTVIAGGKGVQGGWMSVADPRTGLNRQKGDNYLTAGHYGVVPWNQSSGAVSAAAGHDNGRWSVADPRVNVLPAGDEKTVSIIRAEDGTWHRPFTALDLAALQSLFDPDEYWSDDPRIQAEIDSMHAQKRAEYFVLDGNSESAWRERIGNAVPSDSAQAIADVFGVTLLLAGAGETFMLSSMPIWVRPIALALAVAQGGEHA